MMTVELRNTLTHKMKMLLLVGIFILCVSGCEADRRDGSIGGVTEYIEPQLWEVDAQGHNWGGYGLHMTARDMAKLDLHLDNAAKTACCLAKSLGFEIGYAWS